MPRSERSSSVERRRADFDIHRDLRNEDIMYGTLLDGISGVFDRGDLDRNQVIALFDRSRIDVDRDIGREDLILGALNRSDLDQRRIERLVIRAVRVVVSLHERIVHVQGNLHVIHHGTRERERNLAAAGRIDGTVFLDEERDAGRVGSREGHVDRSRPARGLASR